MGKECREKLHIEECSPATQKSRKGQSPSTYVGLGNQTQLAKPSLLLHSCCGPCSTACIERLVEEYNVTVYFYNPNVTEEEEYEKRKAAQKSFIQQYNQDPATSGKVDYMEGPYEPEEFLERVKGLEEEPEGGKRCSVCFLMRLEKTAETAKILNYDYFTTTLTVSPHKDYDTISALGQRLARLYNISYLDSNFKKKDGFKRSIQMSKEYDLYRQNYCGCRFSQWEDKDAVEK